MTTILLFRQTGETFFLLLAGDGEDAGLDKLLKALVGLVQNEQAAFDNGPLLVDLNIRRGKALAGDLLGLTDYLLGLLLHVREDLLGAGIALFHILDIGTDLSLIHI